jgi:hypothetical protein
MPRQPADQSWRLRKRRYADLPEPGFFRTKLVKGGVWVPALIWQPCPMNWEPEYPAADAGWPSEPLIAGWPSHSRAPRARLWAVVRRDGVWQLGQVPAGHGVPAAQGLRAHINGAAADPLEVWQRGFTISAREYHLMIAAKERAERYLPHEPEANPRARIELSRLPSLF